MKKESKDKKQKYEGENEAMGQKEVRRTTREKI